MSAGRRDYLVGYFQREFGSDRVVAADADRSASALRAAKVPLRIPAFDAGDAYWGALERAVSEFDVGLVLSLHDEEVANLSREGAQRLPGVLMGGLPPDRWRIGFDKSATANLLSSAGVLTPPFVDGQELSLTIWDGVAEASGLIAKPRTGSASVGVELVRSRSELASLVALLDARSLLSSYIFQERISGVEFGLDVVNDFKGRYLGTLAREKVAMRAGETDCARTVAPAAFDETAAAISAVTGHRGLIDVDAIVDSDGRPWIIDLNPRFGGGYPFSHCAGANVPALYRDLLLSKRANVRHLSYDVGRLFRKSITLTEVDQASATDEQGLSS